MIILTHKITRRLQYVSAFIGRELTGEPIQLTTDADEFEKSAGPKINYSLVNTEPGFFWIKPHSLLFDTGIHSQNISCSVSNDQKIFFQTEGDFPFDIFAACFYLLSRYEEYLPHQKDFYGRYGHENSLAFQEEFLHLPIINYWLLDFKKALIEKFPAFKPKTNAFKLLPTYDIDEAWSYLNKSAIRTWGASVKSIIKGKWSRFKQRRKTNLRKIKDPYDSYDWLDKLHHKYNIHPRYFFLVAEKNGKYDRNILPANRELLALIRVHAEKYPVGLHPSWQSGDQPSLIRSELKTIEVATGKGIDSSRQHYIRFTLPNTFRNLIAAGIREDYSMGYGTINGFRASVATAFYWYDLEKEEQTELLLIPFCYMEANSFYEQKINAAQALEEMRGYARTVKSVQGLFCSIWHNSFLGTESVFEEWKNAYEEFIRENSA